MQVPPIQKDFRFLDYYRHRQKQADDIKSAAQRLLGCFKIRGHRKFWTNIEQEMQATKLDIAETAAACKVITRAADVVDTAITNVQEKM
ncbi:477_t:CDS:2, partial [Paraglomus brasilianum]